MLGIFVAGAPIILFNAWLSKQGDDEAAVTSAWALASAEMRLGQTIAALQDLAARGVNSCRPGHVDAMRQTALLTGPIKQIMLIAANGEVLCTDTGRARGAPGGADLGRRRQPRHRAGRDPVADRSDRLLRVRKAGQPGKPSLAALVPASLLLPQASTQGGQSLGHCAHRDVRRNAGRRCRA